MSDVLLLSVVIMILLAGFFMTAGSVLYFLVALYRFFRGRREPTDRTREAGPSETAKG